MSDHLPDSVPRTVENLVQNNSTQNNRARNQWKKLKLKIKAANIFRKKLKPTATLSIELEVGEKTFCKSVGWPGVGLYAFALTLAAGKITCNAAAVTRAEESHQLFARVPWTSGLRRSGPVRSIADEWLS